MQHQCCRGGSGVQIAVRKAQAKDAACQKYATDLNSVLNAWLDGSFSSCSHTTPTTTPSTTPTSTPLHGQVECLYTEGIAVLAIATEQECSLQAQYLNTVLPNCDPSVASVKCGSAPEMTKLTLLQVEDGLRFVLEMPSIHRGLGNVTLSRTTASVVPYSLDQLQAPGTNHPKSPAYTQTFHMLLWLWGWCLEWSMAWMLAL